MVDIDNLSPLRIQGRLRSDPAFAPGARFDHRDGIAVASGLVGIMRSFLRPQIPYLIEDYRVGLVTAGHLYGHVNLIERRIETGTIVCLCPGTFLEPLDISDDFNLKGMIVSREAFHVLGRIATPQVFDGRQKDFIWRATDDECRLTEQLIDLTQTVVRSERASRDTVLSMAAAVINHLGDLCRDREQRTATYAPSATTLFDRFIYLLNVHARRERRLDFYADKLCISSKYLCNVVRQSSGRTAKDWIDRAVMTHAKVLLRHDRMPISRIADELNFANPSFFCAYFRRLAGCTPQEYRRGETASS